MHRPNRVRNTAFAASDGRYWYTVAVTGHRLSVQFASGPNDMRLSGLSGEAMSGDSPRAISVASRRMLPCFSASVVQFLMA